MGVIALAIALVSMTRALVSRVELECHTIVFTRDDVSSAEATKAAGAWALALLIPRPPKETDVYYIVCFTDVNKCRQFVYILKKQ